MTASCDRLAAGRECNSQGDASDHKVTSDDPGDESPSPPSHVGRARHRIRNTPRLGSRAGRVTRDFVARSHIGICEDRAASTMYCLLRSEEHPSELQTLLRNSYDVLCLKKIK